MNVLLVDRSQNLRARLARLLMESNGIRVIGEAETAAEAREAARACRPDAVIIDLFIEAGSTINLLGELRARTPSPYIIVLTHDLSTPYRERCLGVADMCLDKSDDMAIVARVLENRLAIEGAGRA